MQFIVNGANKVIFQEKSSSTEMAFKIEKKTILQKKRRETNEMEMLKAKQQSQLNGKYEKLQKEPLIVQNI